MYFCTMYVFSAPSECFSFFLKMLFNSYTSLMTTMPFPRFDSSPGFTIQTFRIFFDFYYFYFFLRAICFRFSNLLYYFKKLVYSASLAPSLMWNVNGMI